MAQDTEEGINELRRDRRSQRSYRGARTSYTREKTRFLKETRERSGRREVERGEERKARAERQGRLDTERAERRAVQESRYKKGQRRRVRRQVYRSTEKGFGAIEGIGRRAFGSVDIRNPKSLILTEMLFVFVVITLYEIHENKEAPKPSAYVGPFFLYLILAFVAQMGREVGRVAAVFGGLMVIAILMTPVKNPRANVINWVSELLNKGQQQQGQSQLPAAPPANNVVELRNFARAGASGRL